MLEELLPSAVVCEERLTDPADAALLAGEEAAVSRAVERRRREYATGRLCARAALARLGGPVVAIGRGSAGEPRWPSGLVGSITHCDGYRAAAVARSSDVAAIGVDAEPHLPLPDDVGPYVLVDEERAWVEGEGGLVPGVCWDRLLFSAKESVYKAWYPGTQRWLDFGDVTVTVDPHRGVFHARLGVPAPAPYAEGIAGRWLVRDGLLLTAVVVLPG
jgi:4'-phosphopantetheinyl transferase EntD